MPMPFAFNCSIVKEYTSEACIEISTGGSSGSGTASTDCVLKTRAIRTALITHYAACNVAGTPDRDSMGSGAHH